MILATDTSTLTTKLILADDSEKVVEELELETGNKLSELLLSLIEELLARHNLKFSDLTGLILVSGPGSFTGLRIGAASLNALAYALNIPIVGVAAKKDWLRAGIKMLASGQNDRIVKLNYGAEPHITQQKK